MDRISQDFYKRLVARDYYVSTEKRSSISAPSSNRTCGFPAYGSPEDCHQRHTQGVARLVPLQVYHSELLHMLVKGFRAFFGITDGLNTDPIHTRRTPIHADQLPGRPQRIGPKDPVIQSVKPEFRFLLRLSAKFLPQIREFSRNRNPLSQFQ